MRDELGGGGREFFRCPGGREQFLARVAAAMCDWRAAEALADRLRALAGPLGRPGGVEEAELDQEDRELLRRAVARRQELAASARAAELEMRLVDEALRQSLGETASVAAGGMQLVSLVKTSQSYFDLGAFRAAHPELASGFTRERAVRALRFCVRPRR